MYSNRITCFLLLVCEITIAFVVQPLRRHNNHGRVNVNDDLLFLSLSMVQVVGLEPEPEGGIVLQPKQSMPGCRMKELEPLLDMKKSSSDVLQYKFWMTAEAEGALIKEIRTQILKDASKKANFPGFRKVRFEITIAYLY
jgi:hypothetical protein